MKRRAPECIATPFRFGVNFSYYGLSLDVSGLGLNVYQTQLLFGAVEVPSKLLVYLLVRHAGRRLTQAGTLLGAALAFGARLLVTSGEPHPGAPPTHRRPRLLAQSSCPFAEAPTQSPPFGQPPTLEFSVSHKARSLPEPLFL